MVVAGLEEFAPRIVPRLRCPQLHEDPELAAEGDDEEEAGEQTASQGHHQQPALEDQ